jgi:hypothetical protein
VSKDANSTYTNKHAWTKESNMIFIDQPVNVGFSYGSEGYSVGTSEQAAVDLHAFLVLFHQAFPAFKDREFHLSGESYGGRYLPLMASRILHENEKVAVQGSTKPRINLTSVLIGNGLTDVVTMTTSYYEQACAKSNGVGRPVLDIQSALLPLDRSSLIRGGQHASRCRKSSRRAIAGWRRCAGPSERSRIARRRTATCPTVKTRADHRGSMLFCAENLEDPLIRGHINPCASIRCLDIIADAVYTDDISKPCTTLGENLCYPETDVIGDFLDRPHVREILGVDPRIGKYESCNWKVRCPRLFPVCRSRTRRSLPPSTETTIASRRRTST